MLKWLKDLLKEDPTDTDDLAFRVHYKATVLLLAMFATFVMSWQYLGTPVECTANKPVPFTNENADAELWRPDIDGDVDVDIGVDVDEDDQADSPCWVYSTLTPGESGNKCRGPAPCLHSERVTYHRYHFVCFVLFMQAAYFYLPRSLWRTWEAGRIRSLVADAVDCPAAVIHQLADRRHRRSRAVYFRRYALCVGLNLLNTMAQMLFLDYFVDGEFSRHGLRTAIRHAAQDPAVRTDPMAAVFPVVKYCAIRRQRGAHGGMVGSTAAIVFEKMCFMPLNAVNEAIYLFICAWFVCLILLTMAAIAYRAAASVSVAVRRSSLAAIAPLNTAAEVGIVATASLPGDWFVLYMLGKNVNRPVFKQIVSGLAEKYGGYGRRGRRSTIATVTAMTTTTPPTVTMAMAKHPRHDYVRAHDTIDSPV